MTSTGAIRWDSLRSCYGYGRWKIWLKLGKGWSSWSISITSESTVLSRLKMAETIGWPHRSSVVDTTRLFLWSKNGFDGKQKSLKGPWPSVATRGFNQLDARAAYRMSRSRRWHAIRGDRRAGTWRGRICRPAASRRGPGVTQRASISTTSFRRRFFFPFRDPPPPPPPAIQPSWSSWTRPLSFIDRRYDVGCRCRTNLRATTRTTTATSEPTTIERPEVGWGLGGWRERNPDQK